jgi:hypothetical protein
MVTVEMRVIRIKAETALIKVQVKPVRFVAEK